MIQQQKQLLVKNIRRKQKWIFISLADGINVYHPWGFFLIFFFSFRTQYVLLDLLMNTTTVHIIEIKNKLEIQWKYLIKQKQ